MWGKSSIVVVGSAVTCSAEEGFNSYVAEEIVVYSTIGCSNIYSGAASVICLETIWSGCAFEVSFIGCSAINCSDGPAMGKLGVIVV